MVKLKEMEVEILVSQNAIAAKDDFGGTLPFSQLYDFHPLYIAKYFLTLTDETCQTIPPCIVFFNFPVYFRSCTIEQESRKIKS